MSFHDTRLRGRRLSLNSEAFRRGIAKGAFSFTLFPRSPSINLGSIRDDWRAVGGDMAKAMKRTEVCD